MLDDGHSIRIGTAEFEFRQSEEPPTAPEPEVETYTETVVREASVHIADTSIFGLAAVRDAEQAKQLLVLYQLAIKLLGCDNDHPDDVVRIALDLLRDHTRASVVGFLWVDDAGRLKPKLAIPEGSVDTVSFSDSLTELVCRQGHAVWIAKQRGSTTQTDSLAHYADALCVPLISHRNTLGAIHVYLEQGRFRQSDFEFAISLANILVVALVRAHKQTTLATDYQRLVEKSAYGELIGQCPGHAGTEIQNQPPRPRHRLVLVRGESGSGKELVARAMHRASPRADRPMLCVNCAAIPAELMESQLFGHKAGAFTSADRDHIGFFQQADIGTLFLDEVGELTLEGQAKLLRILEGHPFLPVGSTQEVSVDVRVIAATNQDLQTYVRQKKFREDLYYRLSVFELIIPPLRDRGSDIEMLVEFLPRSLPPPARPPQLGTGPRSPPKTALLQLARQRPPIAQRDR